MEEPVQRRARSRDVCAEGARGANLLGERRAHEIVRRQGGEIPGALHRGEPVEQRLAPLGEAGHVLPRVEGCVHVGCRRLRGIARQEGDDPEVLRQVERLELAAVPRAELRTVGEEEWDVGSDLRGQAAQLLGRQRLGQHLVGEPKRGRGVGAAAAEPGGDRDLLLDPDAPARLDARTAGKLAERRAHERVVREALHPKLLRLLELDPVDEVDALQDGQDLVLAVIAQWADHQGEVDLGRSGGTAHGKALTSATNSPGTSASARVSAGRPIAASAAAASSREASPACATEFGSVFRRWAKAAVTSSFTRPKSAGSSVRRKATSAESTFGWGRKTVRETAWEPVRSAASWTSTETAPYSFVPGCAKNLSATSRCTITHQSRRLGSPSRLSTTSGVATLYGRFATSFVASCGSSIRSASPKTRSTFAGRSLSAGSSARSISIAWTRRTLSAR